MKLLWAAEPDSLKLYLEKLENATPEQITAAGSIFDPQTASDILSIDGSHATISINGFLSPNGPTPLDKWLGVGGTGFNQIQEAVRLILADDKVKDVTLKMDTPGGTVTGTDETYQALAKLAQEKTLIAENHGMIASGGYWISLAAHKIVAMSPSAETGSIGVILATYDFSGMYESWGIKQVVIVSKNAPDKDSRISTEKGRDRIQKRIDSLENVFIARVAEGRNVSVETVISDFGQGGVLIAQDPNSENPDAVSVGMIDRVVAPVGQSNAINKVELNISHQLNMEEVNMTLQELLAANLGPKAEFDAAISTAENKGRDEEKERAEARIKAATPFLDSDSYPKAVVGLAIKVLTGDASADALQSAVTVLDAQKESSATAAATKKTDELKDTPPKSPAAGAEGGISTEDDLDASAAKIRGAEPTSKAGE